MTQDINLLTPASGRRSPLPTAKQAGLVLLMTMLAGACLGFWYEHRRGEFEHVTRALQSSIDDLVFSIGERSYSLAENDVDPARLTELRRLEGEAEDKSRVLNLLSGKTVGNAHGFSEHLAAFGRRHPEGLWLEQILIGAGGSQLGLRGLTVDADLVPQFIRALQQEPVLTGTAFSAFALSGAEAGGSPMRFTMSTRCEPEVAGEPVLPCGFPAAGDPES